MPVAEPVANVRIRKENNRTLIDFVIAEPPETEWMWMARRGIGAVIVNYGHVPIEAYQMLLVKPEGLEENTKFEDIEELEGKIVEAQYNETNRAVNPREPKSYDSAPAVKIPTAILKPLASSLFGIIFDRFPEDFPEEAIIAQEVIGYVRQNCYRHSLP